MDSWNKDESILREHIADLERQIEELSTCELCDGPVKEVAVCLSCWNKMAPKVTDLERQLAEAKAQIEDLRDRLENGIRYDEMDNQYVLVWTQKELDDAKKEAEEIMKIFKPLEQTQ